MADDTSKQGADDRNRVSAAEGNDREKLDAAVAQPTGDKKTAPAKRQVAASSGTKAVAKTRAARPVKAPVAARIATAATKPVAKIAKAATAAAKPATDLAAPTTKAISDTAKSIATTARRASASARKSVKAAPGKVKTNAGKTQPPARSRTAAVLGAAAAGLVAGLAVNLGRKAIVQAPSLMAGDWFEALKTEHALALALFDQIETTSDAEPAKRTVLLIQLKHALSKHAFTEENVIYPALRDWGDKADADKLNHDHGYVKQHLYDLEALDNASLAFLPAIAIFRADLEAHIREEEDAIFPPLHAGLDDAQNAKITALANKEGFKLA